jgi:hypothetical protein
MKSSELVRSAILRSLDEEKQGTSRSTVWALVSAALAYLLLGEFLGWMFLEIPMVEWRILAAGWAISFGVAVWFFIRPQPRLQVRGYWTPMVLSSLILMVIAALGVQAVVCPHFLFVETRLSDSLVVFQKIRHFYMQVGGMAGCLFLCD